MNGGYSQKAGVEHACYDAGEYYQQYHKGSWSAVRQVAHHQCAAQSTHYHYTFKAQIDYAGMLGEAAAKGHQQQNRSEQQGVLYQQYH